MPNQPSRSNGPVRVFIIPSFHYDVVYLKSYTEYLEIGLQIIDAALGILDRHADYRFLIEQVILLRAYWDRFPDRRAALRTHAASGRLSVAPGMFVMPDMNHPDGESMYLQSTIGKRWLREHLGLDPEVAWIADCWGHHAQLPQVLSQSGYRYYVFWRCMPRDLLRNHYVWKGLDGSTMKTHWLAGGYSGLSFPDATGLSNELDQGFVETNRDALAAEAARIGRYGEPETVLVGNGGDFRFPQESGIGIISGLNALKGELRARFATPEEYLREIDWTGLPVVDGELNSALQGTFTSNIVLKQTVRRLATRLRSVEALSVALGVPSDRMRLWEMVLKHQFHDTICGTICDDGLYDTLAELRLAEEQIDSALGDLSDDTGRLSAFNPLPFARRDRLTYQGASYLVDLEPYSFAPLEAATVPPTGEAGEAGEAGDGQASSLPLAFQNDYYRATIGRTGFIDSLTACGTTRELVSRAGVPFGVLCMQLDYGDLWLNFEGPISGGSLESSLTQNDRDPLERETDGRVSDRRTFYPHDITATVVERDQARLVVEQRGTLRFWRIQVPYVTRLTLERHSPLISFRTELTPQGAHYRIRAAFPSSIADGTIRHEIPFGIATRGPGEHVCQRWMDYSSATGGIALMNRGIPSNNVDAGTLLLTLFRAVDMEYKAPSLASRHVGIPQRFEYAVMAHGPAATTDIVREAAMYDAPPIVCATRDGTSSSARFSTNRENVVISALRWEGERVFVRLYEACGSATKGCTLTLPDGVVAWETADGLQRSITAPVACTGSLEISMRPFEIRNLLFTVQGTAR